MGHSAGWTAVRMYQAEKQYKCIIGLVSASGDITADTSSPGSAQLSQALGMMARGQGEELVKISNRSYPAYISAATFMDYMKFSPLQSDFFGFNIPNSFITIIECPILVFYGTNADIGGEAELASIYACIKKQPNLNRKVTTTLIKHADHMCTSEEEQVSDTIT